ncbi:aspartate aminotransferase family protein [Fodinicurvata fenggangensis]|uniref:aspartate aminotransferase family protein n=1 Tax=Fodinicurvata fenggangensis TaxID=1121830 RepID=UPI00047EFA0C|nr:aspartate aminotransferase family protein [Fodinicurvata fenggangensis]
MTAILHRQPRQSLPLAVSGDGPYVIDSNGKRYLDASGGAAVSCLGHSHKAVVEAIKDQLDKLPYAHTGFFANQPSEDLAEHLTARAPGNLNKAYFVSGGSEANETAMKLARQYFYEKGEPQRRHFIARRQSYHGNTLGALSIGGNPGRRAVYEPILLPANHVSPCYPYREQPAEESDAAYAQRLADELDAKIRELGPETVIAFVAETVVGATLGAVEPVPGYLKRIREICDRHGILLILDEIMSGMGRTGRLFACDEDGVVPDLLTCAKGLGAGYQPIGACLLSDEIHDTIVGGSGAFQHGFTYIGHATACAGALEVQRTIEREGLLENVQQQGARLRQGLEARFGNHPHVGDIRGRGLFLGIELVQDRATKQPFDPSHKLFARIKAQAMEHGLMCYPNGGTKDGQSGDHILLAPPFIIGAQQIEEILERLEGAVQAAIHEIGGNP